MFLHKIPGSCIELDVDGIALRLNDAWVRRNDAGVRLNGVGLPVAAFIPSVIIIIMFLIKYYNKFF